MENTLPVEWEQLTDAQRVGYLLAIGDRAEFVTVIRGQLPLGPDGRSDRLTVRELAQVVLLLDAGGLVAPMEDETLSAEQLVSTSSRAEFVTVIRGQLPLGPDGASDRLTVRELAQVVLLLDAAGLVGPLEPEE